MLGWTDVRIDVPMNKRKTGSLYSAMPEAGATETQIPQPILLKSAIQATLYCVSEV